MHLIRLIDWGAALEKGGGGYTSTLAILHGWQNSNCHVSLSSRGFFHLSSHMFLTPYPPGGFESQEWKSQLLIAFIQLVTDCKPYVLTALWGEMHAAHAHCTTLGVFAHCAPCTLLLCQVS